MHARTHTHLYVYRCTQYMSVYCIYAAYERRYVPHKEIPCTRRQERADYPKTSRSAPAGDGGKGLMCLQGLGFRGLGV